MSISVTGLMISGLARAAQALSEPAYVERARQAIEFLRTHALQPDGRVLRAAYVGEDGEIAPCRYCTQCNHYINLKRTHHIRNRTEIQLIYLKQYNSKISNSI